ncbi:intermembrane lipid transfer protein VPS13C-like [Salvelinus sp. IW2-2015]|uniref:intermembrane lipid transfer protein VPS13C-like n=1 Tax=Salvelinus sp. IW2-2015 TaxID=2691554 RepID=UPI0038D404C5
MIDVTYTQSASERQVVAVLQKLYLCASVEFSMAVADFFIQALPQSFRQAVPTNTMLALPDLAKTSHYPSNSWPSFGIEPPLTPKQAPVPGPSCVLSITRPRGDVSPLLSPPRRSSSQAKLVLSY